MLRTIYILLKHSDILHSVLIFCPCCLAIIGDFIRFQVPCLEVSNDQNSSNLVLRTRQDFVANGFRLRGLDHQT